MNRFIVTGSKGFIGSRLVAELKRNGGEVTEIDIGDKVDDLTGEYDVFYNLAWVGKGGALRADYKVQIQNVRNSMDYYMKACELKCKRFICTGTIGEKMVALPECAKLRSQNFVYINSKSYLHKVLNSLENPDCKVVWATLGNLYGAGDSGGNIIDYTLRTILSGKKAIFGPANQPYDFIYVDDCIRALALLGVSDDIKSDAFYVGEGRPRKFAEFLKICGEIAGCSDLVGIGERPDDGTRYKAEWFDISKLTEEAGFKPIIGFEEGVLKNITWLQKEM